jgi:endonuclease/exonuclease/phosphatase family metal-dependent hydrolase
MFRLSRIDSGSPLFKVSCIVLFACLWAREPAFAQTGTFIDRQLPTDLRMMTYNILWDSIFPEKNATAAAKFSRVVNAIAPDILNLQEIGDPFTSGWTPKTASDVRNLLNTIAPLAGGTSWYTWQGSDAVIASKYPLTMTRTTTVPAGDKSQAIALVNLPDDLYPSDFYLLNEHYKCCGGEGSSEDAQRQRQSDSIVNWLRDAQSPGGAVNLAPGTPFAVVGDLNLVGGPQPLNTLITGSIINNSTYGADTPPDWDGSNLTDASPSHNAAGSVFYTWRDDGSGFSSSQMDHIIYSDSALDVGNKFVLNTVSMTSAQRTAAGLLQYDTSIGNSSSNFDHLPVVVDFRLFAFASSDFNFSRTVDAADFAIWQGNYGLASGASRAMGDANGDGRVDGRDFLVWQQQVSASAPQALVAVPEPSTYLLAVVIGVLAVSRCRS